MDRKEILEQAFDKAEAGDDDTVVLTEGQPDASQQEAVEGAERSGEQAPTPEENQALEDGKGGKKLEKVPSGAVGAKDPKTGKEPKAKDEALSRAAQAAAGSQGEVGKPPVSWKPAAKAAWDKLPVDVKQDVLRREKEMHQYISQNDHHRKFTEGFGQVVRPFMHLIQAQGSTPLQAVRNMMVTAAGLTQGNMDQKARIVAEIIGNYNVDVEVLDKVLAGGGHQMTNRGSAAVDPQIMQALQPVYGFMNEVQQARQQRQARQYQEAEELIEKNADKPFFDDLSDDMADIMEIAAKRGVVMSLDQAYEKAVALNPEVSKIISSQRAQEQARNNGGTRLSQRRRAASTITGAPNGGGGERGAPKNRKEALEAAWDDANL